MPEEDIPQCGFVTALQTKTFCHEQTHFENLPTKSENEFPV